ncbi:MAG: hypothetical protein HUU15_15690 [Candidatus Brocadiae bacterium]|nr:hypothetical protein [Candidatus Brocadiia bacterium]
MALIRFLTLLLPVAAAGCITRDGPVSSVTTIEELDQELAKRQAAVSDLQADIGMTVEGLEHSGNFSAPVVVQPPSRMRMDAIKRMGPTLFTFTMDGDRFLLNLLFDGKAVVGSVKGQERKHPELVAAFAWLSERGEPGDVRGIEEDAADHLTVATRRGGVVVKRTRYERPTLFATRITLFDEGGAEIATVELSDYREVKPPEAWPGPSAWIPWKMTVRGRTEEGNEYRVESKMVRAYINEGLEPGIFDLTPPAGVPVEEAK